MPYAAEIQRVQTLLHHAKQLAGDSVQADERVKSLSSRLDALQQLAGGTTASSVEEIASASEDVQGEQEASEEVAEETTTEEVTSEEIATDEQEA